MTRSEDIGIAEWAEVTLETELTDIQKELLEAFYARFRHDVKTVKTIKGD